MIHPEAGHILVIRDENDDYPGICPYHHRPYYCLEGMASGPAIAGRWGRKAAELSDRTEVWELEALYLAQALNNYILTLSPKRIVLGGGVMKQKQLFPLIREKTAAILNGYRPLPDLDKYIVPPALGDDQGVLGCLKLAISARR
jgi:fructokinase